MSNDPVVIICYGPVSWFEEQLGDRAWDGLLDIVYERDEASRQHTHVIPGQTFPDPAKTKPKSERVVAWSSDYASLNDHVIANFVGLVRSIDTDSLYLHNPPASIHSQLERVFSIEVKRYDYPVVTRGTLVSFCEGFTDHLVGQAAVKEKLLAALYPLTRSERSKPVVMMFYGPSGVGKTETAHFVNGLLGGKLLRKQFSMFHNDEFASYVFGGKHSERSFAHDLLDRESGVILIDEFDKANPVFHSAFYQLFDSGVFEDKNYIVELGRSLIICTSNYQTENEIRNDLGDALYSRFDSLVRFKSISKSEIREVINRIVDGRMLELSSEERAVLDPQCIKNKIYPVANQGYGNVRKLGKLIEEVISLVLVRTVLNYPSQTNKSPNLENME